MVYFDAYEKKKSLLIGSSWRESLSFQANK